MATTLVIVEFLIVGFQVCVWLGLLLGKCSPQARIWIFSHRELDPFIATYALATAYTLGIVFDRLFGAFSSVLQHVSKWLAERPKKSKGSSDDQYRLILHYPEAYAQLQQINRQTRLLRATFWNSLICALIVGIAYRSGWSILLFLFAIACAYTWYRSRIRYHKALDGLCGVLPKGPKNGENGRA